MLVDKASACHGSCNYAQPVEPNNKGMRLPWWGYCAAQFGRQRAFRSPPGGGTRFYTDPVSKQEYKTCGEPAGGWRGDPNYAVCCNGNVEKGVKQGDADKLAACFQNPKAYQVGNAQFFWDAAKNTNRALTDCNPSEQYISNYGTRKYNQDRTCKTKDKCSATQWLAVPPPPNSNIDKKKCKALTQCNPSEQYISNYDTRKYTQDRVCKKLDKCSATQWLTVPPQPNSNIDKTKCKTLTSCKGASQYVSNLFEVKARVGLVDRKCATCPKGRTAVAANAENCACTVCTASQYSEGECKIGADGFVTHQSCKPITNCETYKFEVRPPSKTADRICKTCTQCLANEYQTKACTATSNSVCKKCDECDVADGVFRTGGCKGTENTKCSDCTKSCAAGFYQVGACKPNEDIECKKHTKCVDGLEYMAAKGDANRDTFCFPLTRCSNHEREVTAATATSDRVCGGTGAQLPACPLTHYEATPVGAFATSRDCKPITIACPAGTTELQGPTAASDRKCERCYECAPNMFESSPCGKFKGIPYATTCDNCTECADDEVMAAPCTSMSNRVCVEKIMGGVNASLTVDPAITSEQGDVIIKSSTAIFLNDMNANQEILKLKAELSELHRETALLAEK